MSVEPNANVVGYNEIFVDTNGLSVDTNESLVGTNGTFVGSHNLTPQPFLRKFEFPRAGLHAAGRVRQPSGRSHNLPVIIRDITDVRL